MRKVKSKKREYSCSLCSDSKHVYDTKKNRWVSCECLRKEQTEKKYRQAGIADRFVKLTWSRIINRLKIRTEKSLLELTAACKKLEKGHAPQLWFSVYSSSHSVRTTVRNLVLKAACDGDIEAKTLTVPDLIEIEFNRSQEKNHLSGIPVLALICGDEPAHKYNRHVIESILKKRWEQKLFTLLVAEAPTANLSTIYGSEKIGDMIDEDFIEVRVEPRDK